MGISKINVNGVDVPITPDIEDGSIGKAKLAEAVQESLEKADSAVRFDVEQTLTEEKKAQARQNIGAVSQDYVDEGLAGKQGKLSEQQLANIAAVPGKIDKETFIGIVEDVSIYEEDGVSLEVDIKDPETGIGNAKLITFPTASDENDGIMSAEMAEKLGALPTNEELEQSLAQKLGDAPSDGKQYARKNGAWAEVEGGGGSAGMDLCVITLDMANVILRWPLLKDDVLAFVEAFPSLKDVMIANSADAPYYIEAQDTIDANPDVATNIVAHPAIIRAIATTPAIAPIIVSQDGLDAVIADYPDVSPLIVSYPALAAQVVEYPAICPSLIAWPALAPVLAAETGYIPYLAEDSIIAHSLVDTGKRAWLVGDGVAYINTGLTQSAWPLLFSTRIKHATTGDSRYGGNYGTNNGTSFGIKSKKFYSYSKNEWQPISTAIVAEQEYAFSLKYNGATGREMTVDGSFNENTTIANVLPGATVPFGLFANKGTSPTSYHNGAMSDVQLTIGTSEYHYIPVRKNGKYGMLETSTMTFKGNVASSGRFAVELTNKSDE